MEKLQEKQILLEKANEKINYGNELLNLLSTISHNIEGLPKLYRKIKQELNFLNKICQNDNLKEEHLQCSNLTHFGALIDELIHRTNECIAVKKPFNLEDCKVVVDIICDGGLTWKKVIARNPKSLSEICLGNGNYGVRTLIDQAEDYLLCAQDHPCLFQIPKVIFVFANGVGTNLSKSLENAGIQVDGTRLIDIDDQLSIEFSLNNTQQLLSGETTNILNVNLDVSTMLAYTSSVTNGSCLKYKFDNHVLAQQAQWESLRPVKPLLDEFFKGKTLFCCETAKNSFLDILKTVGGEMEKRRGQQLLERLIVLPDDATVDDIPVPQNNYSFNNVQYNVEDALEVGGKIKERSLRIFTFGDRIRAVTVTSNDGFVRAAKQQGVNFVVFVHESRALTEQKELTRAIVTK